VVAAPFPFGDPGELRGITIYRTGAEETAKIVQDDPIVKAGLLKTEMHPWITGKACWRRDSQCNEVEAHALERIT
jgi:hypothetical protein